MVPKPFVPLSASTGVPKHVHPPTVSMLAKSAQSKVTLTGRSFLDGSYEADLSTRLKALAASQNDADQMPLKKRTNASLKNVQYHSAVKSGKVQNRTPACVSETMVRQSELEMEHSAKTSLPKSTEPIGAPPSSAPNSPGFGPQYSMEFAEGRTESSIASMPLHTLGSPLSSPVTRHKNLPPSSTWQMMDLGSSPAVFPAITISPVVKHAPFPSSLQLLDGSESSSPIAATSDSDVSESLVRARPMSPMAVGSDIIANNRLAGQRAMSPPAGGFEPSAADALAGHRPLSPVGVGSDGVVSSNSYSDDRPMTPLAAVGAGFSSNDSLGVGRSITPVHGSSDMIRHSSSATPMEMDSAAELDVNDAPNSSSHHATNDATSHFAIGSLLDPAGMDADGALSAARKNAGTDTLDVRLSIPSPFETHF